MFVVTDHLISLLRFKFTSFSFIRCSFIFCKKGSSKHGELTIKIRMVSCFNRSRRRMLHKVVTDETDKGTRKWNSTRRKGLHRKGCNQYLLNNLPPLLRSRRGHDIHNLTLAYFFLLLFDKEVISRVRIMWHGAWKVDIYVPSMTSQLIK